MLIVLTSSGQVPHVLPRQGTLSVGRGTDCDICIEDSSVSRRHALIHVGTSCQVEDCGSANGTRVGRAPILGTGDGAGTARSDPERDLLAKGERADLALGAVVSFGTVSAMLQRASDPVRDTVKAAAPPEIVVADPVTAGLHQLAATVANSGMPVLLLGETGTGKEVFAEIIWKRSPRAERGFIKLNCAALPEALLESELFGHERGAFTGAHGAKKGLFEEADGGTMFLDEIGELSPSMQTKLLRVLEDGQILRLGALRSTAIDVRFVFATNRDLGAEVLRGTFRSDLYYRINAAIIHIPPLRERRGEIAPLAELFARLASERRGHRAPPILPAAMELLRGYGWPGNVRELRNAVERAVVVGAGSPMAPEHLHLDALAPRGMFGNVAANPTALTAADQLERRRILDALERAAGNQSQAARLLGISRGTLVSRLDRYGLPRPRLADRTKS